MPQKTATFERQAKRALKSATLQLKQSRRSFPFYIPLTANHYIWRRVEQGLTNGCGHSPIYCISAINLKLYIPLIDKITLYLLLGVACGVLHPAQGCKILVVKPRPQTPKPQTQKPKTKGPWADTKISWAKLLSMKEGSHNEPQKVRKVQSGPPYLSSKKNLRCTARGRTWSSPPCSVRTSSV